VLLLGVAGCDDTTPTQGDPGPPETLLTYQRSGGFTGLTQRLRVLSDGTATFTNAGGKTKRFEVPEERLSELADTLEDIDWSRAGHEPKNVVCADCYLYDISYERQHASTTAVGNSGRELEDLLALVNAIISEG
jgi:hypothetical protein